MLQILHVSGELIRDGIFLPCLLLGGVFLTLRCGAVQLKKLPLVLKKTAGRLFSRENKGDGISPAQAACTALASTVGTGNIVGTAQAISLGGPGAVFWMWVAAILGMAVKYAEVTLSVRFRCRNPRGELVGGPMYCLERGLGRRFRSLGVLYALFAALAAFGIGNMSQTNSAAKATEHAAALLFPHADGDAVRLVFGMMLAVLTAAILRGGAKKVGRVAERLVPLMSLCFLALSVTVIVCHAQRLGHVFAGIFRSALTPSALFGGAAGAGMREAIRWGVRRSAFSNEAGLGSAAVVQASAETDCPVEQGFWGIFEVLADSVICFVTALTILCSGTEIPFGSPAGSELLAGAYRTVFPPGLTAVFMALSLTLFAFSSVLGWAVIGRCCVQYLFPNSRGTVYLLLFSAAAAIGCVSETELIWALSDVFNAVLALPNFAALVLLSGELHKETEAYFSKT